MIWPKMLPWIALGCAAAGVFQRDPIPLLLAIFLLVGAIYWRRDR